MMRLPISAAESRFPLVVRRTRKRAEDDASQYVTQASVNVMTPLAVLETGLLSAQSISYRSTVYRAVSGLKTFMRADANLNGRRKVTKSDLVIDLLKGNGLSCEPCESIFSQANLRQIGKICGVRKHQLDLLQGRIRFHD